MGRLAHAREHVDVNMQRVQKSRITCRWPPGTVQVVANRVTSASDERAWSVQGWLPSITKMTWATAGPAPVGSDRRGSAARPRSGTPGQVHLVNDGLDDGGRGCGGFRACSRAMLTASQLLLQLRREKISHAAANPTVHPRSRSSARPPRQPGPATRRTVFSGRATRTPARFLSALSTLCRRLATHSPIAENESHPTSRAPGRQLCNVTNRAQVNLLYGNPGKS